MYEAIYIVQYGKIILISLLPSSYAHEHLYAELYILTSLKARRSLNTYKFLAVSRPMDQSNCFINNSFGS